MIFKSQELAIQELNTLASSHRQSILIEGPSGCGKTYLAKQFGSMIKCEELVVLAPKVAEIREAVDQLVFADASIVVIIENLDCGLIAASNTLLKFLEEPSKNISIIVTCRNMNMIPDTIISRSSVVSVGHPLDSDLAEYGRNINPDKFKIMSAHPLWKCARTFSDVDTILSLTEPQLAYFNGLKEYCQFTDSIANIVWKLGHYEDSTATPIELVIRYIMDLVPTGTIKKCGISCISDLNSGRFAQHATLAKFAFNAKYIE